MSDPQPARIIAVIEAQRAALLARDTAALQRYVSQWRDVENALKDSIENLAYAMAERKASGSPVSQSSIYQLDRYQTLLQQTRQQIQDYARQLAPQIESEQASLWQQGQLDANDQIAAIVGASFNRLPIEATNAMIGTTADGSPLRNTLLSHWPNAVDAITRELLRGVALGTSPRVTARRAAAASQASLRQMLSVARTEQLRAYRESSRDLYNRSGVVKQYKRLASKNARTCVLCLADDGTIYKVSEPLPIHVNCRCTSIPIIEGYNIETGKDGAEWFAAQSADTQRQMLGTSRYAMYKDGTPLSAFVSKHNDPTWGAQLTQRRLDQMASTPQVAAIAQSHTAIPVRQFADRNDANRHLVQRSSVREDDISRDEQDALRTYQGGGYELFNKTLRGTLELEDGEKPRFNRLLASLDGVMARSSFQDNVQVHRGMQVSDTAPDAVSLLNSWRVGGIYRERAYLSTTVDKSVITNFGGDDGWDGVTAVSITIRVPAGTRATYMNAVLPRGNIDEYELLIDRGVTYRIVSRKDFDNRVEIEMEIIGHDEE